MQTVLTDERLQRLYQWLEWHIIWMTAPDPHPIIPTSELDGIRTCRDIVHNYAMLRKAAREVMQAAGDRSATRMNLIHELNALDKALKLDLK